MEATQVQQSMIGSDSADPTVLDAYAVLAYLRNETAAGLVTELVLSPHPALGSQRHRRLRSASRPSGLSPPLGALLERSPMNMIAGWYMIDVESRERAVELAAYVSSEPGPGGEPLYGWIDVREIMSEAPSED
ncbi:MAG: hypothetical protein M3Y17_06190 [Actinomycetota bacterium]|nr:hypothetical protein [Actinomycetota bacterium]